MTSLSDTKETHEQKLIRAKEVVARSPLSRPVERLDKPPGREVFASIAEREQQLIIAVHSVAFGWDRYL